MAVLHTSKAATAAGALLALLTLWVLVVQLPIASQDICYSVSQWSLPGSHKMPTKPAAQPSSGSAEMEKATGKFTPEILLSAPRRSAAEPNRAGTYALYSVSTYSFESRKRTTEIKVFDFKTKQSTLINNDEGISEPHWLEDEILYLKSGINGTTHLLVAGIDNDLQAYTAAIVPASFSGLKLNVIEKGKVAIVGTSKSTRNGSMYNAETAIQPPHTGLIYDAPMVRTWDKYNRAETAALFYGVLELAAPHASDAKGRYSLSPLHNALQNTGLESPLSLSSFPSSSDYDISKYGLIFVAKAPELNPATHTRCYTYILKISDFKRPADSSKLQKIETPGLEGAASHPAFCPAGEAAVFLKMREDGHEADKNRLLYVPDVTKPNEVGEILASKDGKGSWDRNPSSTTWSHDGKTLYLIAEDQARGILWSLDMKKSAAEMHDLPKMLTDKGTVSSVFPLGSSSKGLLVSGSSLVDNSYWSIYEPSTSSTSSTSAQFELVSSNSHGGSAFGLSSSQISSFWINSDGRKIHSWLLKPSNFDSSKKYPLAFLIHGGPQGAWSDSWSTKWNPAVFAEQGYIVVTPNPTGSTSYGQQLTDDIQNNWGGWPYDDLYNCFKHIRSNFDFVDTTRATALGASYGGFMINYLQGHEFGREFKALVSHDGIFSQFSQISSDELYFFFRELNGTFWTSDEKRANWERWNPLRYVSNWKTPALIIHSEKDYRLAVTEGIAAFNVLQTLGIESRFLTFPDENHWVLKEENSLLWHTVVFNWINKHVGLPKYRDEPEPERK